MSILDLNKSIKIAELRLITRAGRSRSDLGATRLPAVVVGELRRQLHGFERPKITDVLVSIAAFCARRGVPPPSRATIYNFVARCPAHVYSIGELPAHVRQALYNLDPAGKVPGHQLAFYAFQYGDTRAASFAAGLPWLDLFQADRMRGWRPRSHGLLRAVLRRRAIT